MGMRTHEYSSVGGFVLFFFLAFAGVLFLVLSGL